MKEEMQLLSVFTVHLALPFPNMTILASYCKVEKKETVAFPLAISGQCPKTTTGRFRGILPPSSCIQKTLSYQFEAYSERFLWERLWGGG